MKLRDWFIAMAGMALLGLVYADRQRADAESAGRDQIALYEAAR